MKQRIVYIDNLKALAIFTVVIGHVFYFTWNKYNDNVWNNFISVYNMPLFFFLSGMFAKEGLSFKHIGRKAKQLLIPTATIGGTYAYFNNGIHDYLFGGGTFWLLVFANLVYNVYFLLCQMPNSKAFFL